MSATAERGVMFTLKVKEDDQAAQIMKRFGAKLEKAEIAQAQAGVKAVNQAAQERERILEQSASRQMAAHQRAQQEQTRSTKSAIDQQIEARKKQTQAYEAEIKKQKQAFESSKAKMTAATGAMSGAIGAAAGGLAEFASGWAYLGISSKESSEEMLKALLKVQGVLKITRGGIEIYRGLTEGVKAYRAAVIAAATAEEAAAKIRAALRTTGGVPGGKPGSRLAENMGAGASGGLITKGGGAVALTAASVAALAGAIAAGTSGVLTGREAWRHGAGGGATEGSLVGRVGSSRWNPFAQIIGRGWGGGGYLGMPGGRDEFAEEDRLKRQTSRGETRRTATETFKTDSATAWAAALNEYLSSTTSRTASRLKSSGNPPRLVDAALDFDASALFIRNSFGEHYPVLVRSPPVLGHRNKEIASAEKRRDLARKEPTERLKTADELIAKARKESDIHKQDIERNQASLQSGAERFATMDPLEQRRMIMLKQKADRNEQLSAKEYGTLGRIGTQEAKEQSSRGLRRIAERRGFSRHFGKQERETIAKSREDRRQLAVEIKDQRQFKIDTSRNDDALVERMSQTIVEKVRQREAALERRVQAKVDQKLQAERDVTNQFQAARAGGLR